MIRLTALSQTLLPTQMRLNSCFKVHLVRENFDGSTEPMHATLCLGQEPKHVQFNLRACGEYHTLTLDRAPADQMADQVTNWIEDCANGRLERAA